MAKKRIDQLKDWFTGDSEINAEWVKRARRSFQFYTGVQQWDPAVVAVLRAKGRPALTINRILSTVHVPCGYQRRNRSDIRLYPRKGGTRPVAELGSSLIKHTMDISQGHYEASDSFLDGTVTGKGWLSIRVDYSNDPLNGDLVISKESAFEMMGDQNNQHYDLNRGERVWKSTWVPKRQVQLEYGKSAKDLDEAMDSSEWAVEAHPGTPDWDDYVEDDTAVFGHGSSDGEKFLRETNYLVRECWYTVTERAVWLINRETLDLRRLRNADAVKAAKVLLDNPVARAEFRIIEKPGKVLHRCVTVGDMEIEYEEDPLRGVMLFPFFRFMPYLADGFAFGLVDNAIQPQEEYNKRLSQTLHSANQTANSGWIVGSSSNDEAMRKLEQFGSKPDVILDQSDYTSLEKIAPNPIDQANLVLAQEAGNNIPKVTGINDDLLGTRNKDESGKARMVRQEAGLTVSEIMFDNFNRMQAALGEATWEIIRRGDTYSAEEIEAVVTEDSLKHFVRTDEITGDQTVDMSPMRNWTTGRYGVRVSRGANSPTMRMALFEQLLDAVKAGVLIPPKELIEASDLPNKEAIIEVMEQQQQMVGPDGRPMQPMAAGAA